MRLARTPALAATAAQDALLVQRCSCGSSGQAASGMCEECQDKAALGLQPKLVVGAVDDAYEHEADRAAETVTADRGASVARRVAPVATVSRRTGPSAAGAGQPAPRRVARTIARTGEPLGRSARAYFEPRFGHDFGSVRVHRDAEAAASARDIAARAYTVGNHVVFGSGSYSPESRGGRSLIAHELAHVIQQTGTVQRHRLAPQPIGRSSEGEEEEDELQLADEPEAEEEPPTDTMIGKPSDEEAEAGASGIAQRQPLDGLLDDEESGDAWPEKTEAATVAAEMEASEKCLEETPEDPAECEPSTPLTWEDFQKKPPKSKFAGATWSSLKKRPTNTRLLECMPKSAAAETAAPEGVQAFFDPAKSWVMKIYKDTSNPKLEPCKTTVGKCKKYFRKNRKKMNIWWAMRQGDCEASPAPRGDKAWSSDDCDTVVAKDCADSIVADSPRLLAHEQGHFDLTCAMAKKTNALITKDTNVDKLIKTAKKVLKTQQKKYDKETNHGCKPDKQGEWDTAIAAGLPDVALKAK